MKFFLRKVFFFFSILSRCFTRSVSTRSTYLSSQHVCPVRFIRNSNSRASFQVETVAIFKSSPLAAARERIAFHSSPHSSPRLPFPCVKRFISSTHTPNSHLSASDKVSQICCEDIRLDSCISGRIVITGSFLSSVIDVLFLVSFFPKLVSPRFLGFFNLIPGFLLNP